MIGDGATSAVALGGSATVTSNAVNAVAAGANATASAANSVALGGGAVANRGAVSGVADALSYSGARVTTTTGAVSVGSVTAQRQITNVAAGTQDTDVVNLGQVKAVKTVVDSNAAAMASALGGGSAVKADGTISAPSYTVGGTTVNNVGAAITNLDTRTTSNTTNIDSLTSNVNSGSVGLVKQNATTNAITVAADKAGTSVNFAGTAGERTLSGVKDGTLAASSKEAVSGGQLFTTNQNVTANTNAIGVLDTRVTTVEGSVTNLTNNMNSGSVGLVKQDATTNAITVAADKAGTSVNFAGTDGARTLSGVKAGTLAAGSKEAVNGGQLFATGLVDDNGNALKALTYDSAAKDSITLGGTGATAPVKLKNVADGTDETDAVNVRQLQSTGLIDDNGKSRDAVTYDAGSNRGVVTFGGGADGTLLTNVRDGQIGAGSRDAVNGGQIDSLRASLQTQITNIDGRVTNVETNGVGGGSPSYIDSNAKGSSDNKANAGDSAGVAVGYNANATGDNASALGQNATALGSYGTAVGNDSHAAGANDTALGGNAKVYADGSVAVGANTVVSAAATNAVAVGADAQVNAASGTAIGQGASVTAAATGAVALGQGSVADRANTVSVGSAGNERAIANVADAVMATDAVNKRQLDAVAESGQAYTDARVNQVQSEIASVKRDSNAAAASAMAVATLPQSIIPGRGMASAALSNMGGESALAVGVSKVSENSRWVTKLSGTVNTRGNAGVSAGIGFHW